MFDRIDLKTRFAVGGTVLFLLATWLPLRQALSAHREDVARQIAEEQANDVARVAAGVNHTLKLRIAALEAVASGIRPEWSSRPGKSSATWPDTRVSATCSGSAWRSSRPRAGF